jgi:hypothetical protein
MRLPIFFVKRKNGIDTRRALWDLITVKANGATT